MSKEEPRGAKRGAERPVRRCCRRLGACLPRREQQVLEQIEAKPGDALDKERHEGEGCSEDDAEVWGAAGEQPWRGRARGCGAWFWVLPVAHLQAMQPTTSQSPLFAPQEPQAQGSPGEDGFPAREAGTQL